MTSQNPQSASLNQDTSEHLTEQGGHVQELNSKDIILQKLAALRNNVNNVNNTNEQIQQQTPPQEIQNSYFPHFNETNDEHLNNEIAKANLDYSTLSTPNLGYTEENIAKLQPTEVHYNQQFQFAPVTEPVQFSQSNSTNFSAEYSARFVNQLVQQKTEQNFSFANLLPSQNTISSITPSDEEIKHIQLKTNTIGSIQQQISAKNNQNINNTLSDKHSFLQIRTTPLQQVTSKPETTTVENNVNNQTYNQQDILPASANNTQSSRTIAKKLPSANQQKAVKKRKQAKPSQLTSSIQKATTGTVVGADEFEKAVLSLLTIAIKNRD